MMNDLIEAVNRCLNDHQPVVIATVVSQAGSTPRTAGTQMLVMPNNRIAGTIGGGKVEADVIQAASTLFNSGKARLVSFDLNQSGMSDDLDIICGGSMSVLIESIDCSGENTVFYQALHRQYQVDAPCHTLTALSPEEGGLLVSGRLLVMQDGTVAGGLSMAEEAVKQLTSKTSDRQVTVFLSHGAQRFLIQYHRGPQGVVYIFGAGHVSRELAGLTRKVGFCTVVLDDRKEFANRRRFGGADEVVVLKSFEQAFESRAIDDNSHIVIVTRGHSHDKTVLAQALKTDAGYVGMIGSRRKRDIIYQKLLAESFQQADIDRVHCPIGLDIGAETPEEIAVSILAELIRHRALNRARRIRKGSANDV